MMKIFLIAVVMLMLVVVCYGQLYEPEHLWHWCGVDSGDWFGRYVAGIGDVNSDGLGDFLARDKIDDEGVIDLFFGGDPPDSIPDVIFRKPNPNYTYFGPHFNNIGDVNGDQHEDFAVSVRYIDGDSSFVFIYFGGCPLDTIPDVVMAWSPFTDGFGSNIEGIGDVNNDGYDDIAVQAANYGGGRGKVWVYFGGSPIDSIADWEQEVIRGYAW